jgi:hypothetical protein
VKKVFLGGTCGGSAWRQELKSNLLIAYYDPCGDQWTEEMMAEEIRQRSECDFCLYVLTPQLEGFYSVAEVIDDSNKQPEKTIFCFLATDNEKSFSDFQLRSLEQVAAMVKRNGATYFKTLREVIDFLNQQKS